MRAIIAVEKDFYLEVPLEVLHRHCLEWMEEIAFWKTETAFFHQLISRGMKTNPEVFKSAEAKKTQKQLIQMTSRQLDEWLRDIKGHEKLLVRTLKKPGLNTKLYRLEHKKLVTRFRKFEAEYRRMKKRIFALALKGSLVKRK